MRIAAYFAYGSNMNPARVSERGLSWSSCESATLLDFTLRFNKASALHAGEGHANIEFAPGERVEGVLYALDADAEILKMDPFEKAPWNYGRDAVCVTTSEGERWGWTYFANAALLKDDLLPSSGYLSHLLAGRPFLSEAYFGALAQHPVASL